MVDCHANILLSNQIHKLHVLTRFSAFVSHKMLNSWPEVAWHRGNILNRDANENLVRRQLFLFCFRQDLFNVSFGNVSFGVSFFERIASCSRTRIGTIQQSESFG